MIIVDRVLPHFANRRMMRLSPARRAFAPWRTFLALGLTALMLLVGSGAAGAHTELLGSDPADGASVATSPSQVTLTFSQEVQAGFSSITVVGPDGTQFQAGTVVENGPTVSVPVRPLSAPGEYTTGYRVLSADGHPVDGSVRFTFSGSPAQPTATTPSTTAGSITTTPAPTASGGQNSDGTPLWPWVLGVAALLSAGVIAALRIGRTR